MLNLNQLRAFYQVAKCQNVSLAARQLFVSQPAVTAQVKLFEESCGLKLFKKKGRNLILTDAGKTLFNFSRKIFEYEEKIEDAVAQMKALRKGKLKLGSARTYARYFMPFLLTGFRDTFPDIKIYLDEGSSREIIQSLIELKNEVVIIARVDDHPNIAYIPFSREELVLILSPHHRRASQRRISFEQIAKEPIIMKDSGSGTRRLVDDLFLNYGLTPNVLMETGDAEIIKLLVQHGEGISFLVKEAVAVELREKKLVSVPLTAESIFLDVTIAYLMNQPLSPPAQAFLDSLKELGTKKMRFQGMGALMTKMLAEER
ncbi:MAG: LysR family transcriptional regulator [Desulfobacterales bacterium]